MSKDRNALKAGTFIIVTLILICAIIVGIKGAGQLFDPMQNRTITFSLRDDVGGLRIGDDVRIGGYKVGVVKAIELGTRPAAGPSTRPTATASEPAVLVSIALPRRYIVRSDALVGIQSTVTGQSWVNFESLGTSGTELAEGQALVGTAAGLTVAISSLREMAPKLNQTLGEVQQIVADVRKQTMPLVNETIGKYGKTADTFTATGEAGKSFVGDIRGYLKPVIDRYYAVADSTTRMMTEVANIMGDTKTDIRGTMANLNSATGSMKDKLPVILDQVTDTLKKVDGAVVNAAAALEDLKGVTGSAKTFMTGNKNRLDEMVRHLNATSLNLELAAAEIRARPWRLLYSPKKGEVNNLVLFDSAREFAVGAAELNTAAQALRDAAAAKESDPEKIKKLEGQLQEAFDRFSEVEKKLWDGLK